MVHLHCLQTHNRHLHTGQIKPPLMQVQSALSLLPEDEFVYYYYYVCIHLSYHRLCWGMRDYLPVPAGQLQTVHLNSAAQTKSICHYSSKYYKRIGTDWPVIAWQSSKDRGVLTAFRRTQMTNKCFKPY